MFDFLSTNDPNLYQGQLMLDRRKKLLIIGQQQMKLLEQTSSSKLGSIIEPLVSTMNSETATDLNSLSVLEDEFNRTLTKYTANYRLLMKEIMDTNDTSILKKFANKNVSLNNDKYYVNNYGFLHLYPDKQSWDNRNKSCDSDAIPIRQEEVDKLLKSSNMGTGQACDVAGSNIQNKSGQHAWVDVKGIKHNWNDKWATRSESCQVDAQLLDDNAFSSIPSDASNPPLANDFNCNRLNVDPIIISNLGKLNARLLTLGRQIEYQTSKFAAGDKELKGQLEVLNTNITNQIKSLEQDHQEFSRVNNGNERHRSTQDILGIRTSSEFILSTNYLKYIVALILVLLLILYTSYAYSSDNISKVSIIILCGAVLFLLYKLVNYINYKFF